MPVHAAASGEGDPTGRLPGAAAFVRLKVDAVQGAMAHYQAVELVVGAEDGRTLAPPPLEGWIPLARIGLSGEWASSGSGTLYAPTVFSQPSLQSEVVAVHDTPCGAVPTCGFANEAVLGCAGSWARVRTDHGSEGWLHFDHQCDHRLTNCSSKEVGELARFRAPSELPSVQ